MDKQIVLGPCAVSRDGPPVVIAELGVNHNGSEAVARQMILAAAESGADAVKFQLFDAGMLLASDAGLVEYQRASAGSATELLSGLQLSAAQLAPLVKLAHAYSMGVLVTPFSLPLVEVAVQVGADAIKLASPDLVNLPLIESAVSAGLPLVLSTGGATMEEIARAVRWAHAASGRLVLLQCTSSYPTAPADANIGCITRLRQIHDRLPIGYSDHTQETVSGGLAVAAGACLLEKHFTLDRASEGPDHSSSLDPLQFKAYAALCRQAYTMRGSGSKMPLETERAVHAQTRQSVVLTRDLPPGTVLRENDLTVKRPGTGIPACELRVVLGRRLATGVAANSVLHWQHLQEAT